MSIRRFLIGIILLIIALFLGLPYFSNMFSPVQIKKQQTLVKLYIHDQNKIVNITLDDYVMGVVAAEMPASFPLETLKAQAVVARTYILKRLNSGGLLNPPHAGADICDDHRHGQAWISKEEMKKRWGSLSYYYYYNKIAQAVKDTRGFVIVYKGSLIDPVYHSSCGGKGTESAEEVWRFGEPYLVGVSCPYCSDPRPVQNSFLSVTKVSSLLSLNSGALPATGKLDGSTRSAVPLMKVIRYTHSGRPKEIKIGDNIYSAVTVRDLLNLRSADFTMELVNGEVEVTTRGYGHAVGMCQYGAKGFADHGYSFGKIIKRYYKGVDVVKLPER
jgi:stage II sporulation protein D